MTRRVIFERRIRDVRITLHHERTEPCPVQAATWIWKNEAWLRVKVRGLTLFVSWIPSPQ